MGGLKRGLTLVGLLMAIALSGGKTAMAQLATTTIQDVVYSANGTPAAGSVVVSWNAFTTANGTAVTAGSTSVTIAAGGVLTVALAPNAGSIPMGSYYTAVFHLNDGTTTREYWVVPVAVAGGSPAKLAAISTPVLPVSVAMQTVSKAYVDNAIAAAEHGTPWDASPYVEKAGDTMTGPLVLPGDPVTPTQAADMHYVDTNVAALSSGLGQKVSTVPSATQVVAQPSGTQLEVNLLNGDVYASQYLAGLTSGGIAAALATPDCSAGCTVQVEATYPGHDAVPTPSVPPSTLVIDDRGGARAQTSVDPLSFSSSFSNSAASVTSTSVRSAAALAGLSSGATLSSFAMSLQNSGLTGGSNLFPENIEAVPYFKSTYGVLNLNGLYNTQGQHVQLNNIVNCYGIGDCLAGAQTITSEGGLRDSADEGTHPYDLTVREDNQTFSGTCSAGCTTGSAGLTVAATLGIGTQGDGRFLIDKNPAKVLSTGTLVGSGNGVFAEAIFSGTSFPASVFLTTSQAATSQATNMAPGTVTLPIATTGVAAGYATNTAALPATSGVACVADPPGYLANFETVNYTVVDASHIQLGLNKVHELGATISVGGLCGYGLESTVDTSGPLRQVFPVIGAVNASTLYYAAGVTQIVGVEGTTTAFLNAQFSIAAIERTGNVVTLTTSANMPDDVTGLTVAVSGVADASYNGSFVVTTTSATTLTYADTGADSTSSGGRINLLTGGYALYPMAEVLSVYDPATKTVDGFLGLAPNTIAWASGDAVEEPHYFQQRTAADLELITQYLPRPLLEQNAGKSYGGTVGPGLRGWLVANTEPASDYIGSGGTHRIPDDAYTVEGVWNNDFEVEAGEHALMRVHCNAHTCNRWNSGYALFDLDSNTAFGDQLYFYPQLSMFDFNMQGSQYTFTQNAFSAPTINVGTLNATTITGGIDGGAITTGIISASRLPLFGPSGTSHAPGIVPDPGAIAGATRFLREDGTWNVPATGSGSSPTGAAGGDLGGTYPNPTVVASHIASGSITGVTAVGINTASPGVPLQVGSGSGSDTSSGMILYGSSTGGWATFGDNAGTGQFQFGHDATGGFVKTLTDYPITFATNGYAHTGTTGLARMYPDGGWVIGGTLTDPGSYNFNVQNTLESAAYLGPAAAPTGSCATVGAWVFSQDGHATFCSAGTWLTKL